MSDETNDGVATQTPTIPAEVSQENPSVSNPPVETSDNAATTEETSRRKSKHEEQQKENDALKKRLDDLEGTLQPALKKSKLDESLGKYGIESQNINHDEFVKERDTLVADGMDLAKASDMAVRLQASSIKEGKAKAETLEREKAQEGAQLPPTSTAPSEIVVMTEDQLYSLEGKTFAETREKVMSGEITLAG